MGSGCAVPTGEQHDPCHAANATPEIPPPPGPELPPQPPVELPGLPDEPIVPPPEPDTVPTPVPDNAPPPGRNPAEVGVVSISVRSGAAGAGLHHAARSRSAIGRIEGTVDTVA